MTGCRRVDTCFDPTKERFSPAVDIRQSTEMSSVGDIAAKVFLVQRLLKQVNYPTAIDNSTIQAGDASILLAILRHTVLRFSPYVSRLCLESGFRPQGMNDASFIRGLLQFARNALSIKPMLTAIQFNTPETFLERKLMLVADIMKACKSHAVVEAQKQKLLGIEYILPDGNNKECELARLEDRHPENISSGLEEDETPKEIENPEERPKPRLLPPAIMAHPSIWTGLKKSLDTSTIHQLQGQDYIHSPPPPLFLHTSAVNSAFPHHAATPNMGLAQNNVSTNGAVKVKQQPCTHTKDTVQQDTHRLHSRLLLLETKLEYLSIARQTETKQMEENNTNTNTNNNHIRAIHSTMPLKERMQARLQMAQAILQA